MSAAVHDDTLVSFHKNYDDVYTEEKNKLVNAVDNLTQSTASKLVEKLHLLLLKTSRDMLNDSRAQKHCKDGCWLKELIKILSRASNVFFPNLPFILYSMNPKHFHYFHNCKI